MEKKVAYDFAQKYAKMIESEEQKKQGTLDLYLEMGKFKTSQLPQEKHKISYFNMNYKRILLKFFTEAGQQYTSFDDFLIDFSTWIQSVTFPFSREVIAQPQKQKLPPRQIPKPQIKPNEKQKIEIQPQIQPPQQEKRPQLQIQSNMQMINAPMKTVQVSGQKQQQINRIREKQERQRIMQQKAQQKQRANQEAYEQRRRQGPKVSNPGNQGNQISTNSANPGNSGNSRGGVSKSPIQGRFQENPNPQNQGPKKQDLVKKIVSRIGECYESYQKRSKIHNEIKIDLENLKRLEQIEKGERYPKIDRERR